MNTGEKHRFPAVFLLAALPILAASWAMGTDVARAHEAKRHAAVPAAASVPPKPAAAATYAVWWVIMNNPGYCAGVCGLDDLAAADMGAALFHAAGLAPDSAPPAAPEQESRPPVRYASEPAPRDGVEDTCVPGECTPLQTITFYPPD